MEINDRRSASMSEEEIAAFVITRKRWLRGMNNRMLLWAAFNFKTLTDKRSSTEIQQNAQTVLQRACAISLAEAKRARKGTQQNLPVFDTRLPHIHDCRQARRHQLGLIGLDFNTNRKEAT
jgi:hypothetical protein